MRKSIRKSTLAMKIVPVLAASAFKNKGIQPLLDAVVDYLPSPVDVPPVEGTNPGNDETELRLARDDQPFAALAFKIMSDPFVGHVTYIRVYSGVLKSGSYVCNSANGMGELHLEIIVDRMLREYNVQANVGRPQVAYRETIRKKATAEGKYIKQTGGRGQYGHCKIELHPIPSSSHESMKEMSTDDLDALAKEVVGGPAGKWKFDKEHRFLFIDKIIGGSIPREFIAPIEAGIREALDNGILAGFTMVDVAAVLVDGSYHDVDSSEMAFKIAGSMAFKEACAKASPVLLEPIMKVEVVTPEEYMQQVFGDLNARRSAIQGTENRAGSNVIRVEVPLSQMFGYATDLRSRTQGRATFTMHFSHYAEAPASIAQEVIEKATGKAAR